jgi:hypothetical protein
LALPESRRRTPLLSINAIAPELVKIHWGVEPADVRPQLTGLAKLLQARNRIKESYGEKPLPSIQVSTIIDRKNIMTFRPYAAPWPGSSKSIAWSQGVRIG